MSVEQNQAQAIFDSATIDFSAAGETVELWLVLPTGEVVVIPAADLPTP